MRHRTEHLGLKLILTIVVLLGIAYVAVAALLYEGYFLPGTTIGDEHVSGLTVAQTQDRLQEKLDDYVLTIQAKNGESAEIKGESVDLKYEFNGEIQRLMNEHGSLEWITIYLGKTNHFDMPDIRISYDEDKLNKAISDIPFFDKSNMKAPVNAEVTYSDENGFTLVLSEEGNTIDTDKAAELIGQALLAETDADTLDLESAGCYEEPTVRDDDPSITEVTDVLDPLTDFTITYKIGDSVETIDKVLMYTWYRRNEDGSVSLKESCVQDFVDRLADTYDTVGAEREFKTTSGQTITVKNGPYGWKINRKEEYKELLELVENHKGQENRTPVYSHEGFGERGASDIGNTYIEVSISEQHMWYYEDGKLYLDTDVVTGKGGQHTLKGVGFIHNKARNATLVGPGYVSHVKYWMKVWNGIGIHDSSWRSVYGGKYYLTDGSHGCINTPLDNVIKLYNRVEVGTPVVIYDLNDYK